MRSASIRKYHREYKQKHRQIRTTESNKRENLKRLYKMTLEQYNEMFNAQNGCCAICNKHASNFKRSLHVDHDHSTGKIRALLCNNCNPMLSILENKDFCLKATLYLKRFI
jgi:hypothetical protein